MDDTSSRYPVAFPVSGFMAVALDPGCGACVIGILSAMVNVLSCVPGLCGSGLCVLLGGYIGGVCVLAWVYLALHLWASMSTPRVGCLGGLCRLALINGLVLSVVFSCGFIVSKKLMRLNQLVSSMVPTNVSCGGLLRRTMVSSIVALSKLILLRQGEFLLGNHIRWLTVLSCRVCVAHMV